MTPRQDTDRCWYCDNAIWFLPVWTWTVACITGLLIVGLMRPPSIAAWMLFMGAVMFPIGVCVAVLMDENNRDRDRDAQKVDAALPARAEVRTAQRVR